jgi:molybdopterin-binding protein
MILVTHDFEEAVALGERVAVLNDGQVAQIGTPEEILRQPNSEFVARFGLTRNLFSGVIHSGDDGYALIDINGTKLVGLTDLKGQVHLSVRPEDILISNVELHSTARNSFEGVVTEIVDRGAVMYVTVNVPPGFTCLVTRRSFDELKLGKGVRVWITFKASAVHIF